MVAIKKLKPEVMEQRIKIGVGWIPNLACRLVGEEKTKRSRGNQSIRTNMIIHGGYIRIGSTVAH
jgi:hypothetical protein